MATKDIPRYNRRRAQKKALAAIGVTTEKRPAAGQNVSHAQNTTKRLFKPNLQKAKILIDGRQVSVRVDTRTLRSLTKAIKKRAATGAVKKPAAKKPAAKK